METERLPNLFVAGVPKAGTSSIHTWLSHHDDAVGSRDKETYFFVDPGTHMYRSDFNVENGLAGYETQFPVDPGSHPSVIFESTPSYLYSAAALEHIPDLPTRPRCLFVVREPSSQIFSLFSYFQGNWNWVPPEMSFRDFLAAVRGRSHDFQGNELARDALGNAAYVHHLERWRARLGDERMMVVTFDELARDPRLLMRRIAELAGLDPSFYDSYDFRTENESYAPRSQKLQSVNVALRSRLPKGRLYRALRHAYRALNTRKADGPDAADRAALAELRGEYQESNRKLARTFGVNLDAWV
ncbi:hypothetical protein OCH239_01275 [Roseivivax halodurans JCM 10272]|uniref:Uncharacterized protein n=1 Tax=Roseivivax halodurans JCM 10272 TaxID=1449350 RepID=X7ELD5_9RHOB|nr:sulfotransferase [Roseivivax halodurans]ETX16720.1 hypothetical protein OCH239_01275 [Roseivivax halodurans JCM 10272]